MKALGDASADKAKWTLFDEEGIIKNKQKKSIKYNELVANVVIIRSAAGKMVVSEGAVLTRLSD